MPVVGISVSSVSDVYP